MYSDLGDAPQALEYFHKALDCESINSHIKALAYGQMAWIYNEQRVYDLAIPTYKKAIELNSKNNNHINALYNIHNLGSIYSKQGLKDSALVLYNYIIKRAEELDYPKLIYSTKLNIAELYIFKHDYKQAHKISNSLKNILPKEDSSKIANTFAHLHYRLNNIDSTILYCNELIKSNNLNAQLNGYNILANLHIRNNNTYKAHDAIIMSTKLSDSIQKLQTPLEIRQLSSIYNYQIRERENNKLKQEAQENEIKIMFLISSIVIIVTIALSIIFIIRKRKHIIKLKLRNIELLLKQSNEFSENTIAENYKKIAQLKSQISSINSENQSLIQELENQKKLLELSNEKAIVYQSQKDNAISSFNNDSMVFELHNRLKNYHEGKNIISEKEWEIITKKITLLFPSFINTLHELPFKLSLYEFRISILLKTKFTPKEIARLTNHTDASVSMTRARLHKKLTNSNSHASDWDKFINSL